ncbi:MAG: ATP-binding protein, partial [Polyangiales bacterium]
RVLDDGPGVLEGEMTRVVERSVRGERARTRHPDGRGLGLAITKRVAELHGLTLRFSPVSPRGLQVELAGALGGPGRPVGREITEDRPVLADPPPER